MPAETCSQLVTPWGVVTAVGVDLVVELLSPSWPFQLPPQHAAAPAEEMAHACQPPAATLAQVPLSG